MFNEIFLGVSGLILICVCFSIIKKLHKENPGLSGFSKEKNTIKVFLFPEYSNVELALSNIGALISFYVMIIGTAKAEVGPDVTAADASGNPNKFIYASCPKGSYVSGVAYKGISQKYCTFCNVGIQVSCTKIK